MKRVIERWKEINGFGGKYYVSNKGRVKSERKILKTRVDKRGYEMITITYNKKTFSKFIHRLVLEAFFPISDIANHDGHHKDFNITNNTISNLEWVDSKLNRNTKLSSISSFKMYKTLLSKFGNDVLYEKLKGLLKPPF